MAWVDWSYVVDPDCLFCKIAAGTIPAHVVYEDSQLIAFLDIKPLFPGHLLVCPRGHACTLPDLDPPLIEPLFSKVRLLCLAVETAMDAHGTFVAMNNRVSQTVPHLHVHVVPRRRRDGLKGFFWPRHDYKDAEARETTRAAIEREMRSLLQ